MFCLLVFLQVVKYENELTTPQQLPSPWWHPHCWQPQLYQSPVCKQWHRHKFTKEWVGRAHAHTFIYLKKNMCVYRRKPGPKLKPQQKHYLCVLSQHVIYIHILFWKANKENFQWAKSTKVSGFPTSIQVSQKLSVWCKMYLQKKKLFFHLTMLL